MEIPSNMSIGQALLKQTVSMAVQKMTMETQTQDMEAIKKMMEQSVTPGIGGNIDIRV